MLTGHNRVRDDVLIEDLDERMAPSLGGVVLGKEHEMYADPERFFQRTLITEQMVNVLGNILSVLKDEGGKKILVLSALYGGGKTHTLLTIYHALRAPASILRATPENEEVRKRANRFVEEMSKFGRPDVIVVDGYFSELAPSPISPLDMKTYKVYTLWGYMAHAIGSYSVMRESDEKQVAPEADKLLRLFENRCVVILVDELAHYLKRFHEAQDEGLQRYSSAVASFAEVLAKALDLSKRVVLVISLPVTEKERKVAVETTYRSIEQDLENVFKALKRVFTECIEPIAPRNIPALLRARLFEVVDVKRARDVHDVLYKAYEEDKEVFGEGRTIVEGVTRTYPFHPLYIDTLLDILDKHDGLQKTRDLLRVSRKVLREALRDERPYDLIMPWHIDVTKDSIRNTLLVGDYEGFKPVLEEDINERVKLMGEKQLLSRITALALLARTFVYGGGLTPKVEMFPSEKELALMVYEPAMFHTEGWAPKDIVDVIRWMCESLVYVVKDERTGRLWFTKWVTPIKYVEERAKKIEDLPAIRRVLEYSKRLLRETSDGLMHKRARRAAAKVFDVELSDALRACEPIDLDTRKYVLLACMEVPENYEDRRAKLEEVVYRTSSGGTRRYANTIYVVFPSSRNRISCALDLAKKLMACEEVEKEGLVDKLLIGKSIEEVEIAKEILKRKLEGYKTDVLEKLVLNILSVFDKIAHPHYDEKRLANVVKEVDVATTKDSIIEVAEDSLSKVGKVKTEMDYDVLEYYLKEINVDISEGTEARTVKTIIDFFYSNPRLPAVPKEAILEGIRDGLRRLRVGVKSGGRVFFKRVYEQEAPQISDGEEVSAVDEDDEVLPWRRALEEQLRALKRREFVEKGERMVEEYVVRVAGRELLTEYIVNNMDEFDLEELRRAPIIRIVKRVSMKIKLEKAIIEARPGEAISIRAQITRVGPYSGEVVLRPSIGSVNREKLVVDDAFTQEEITWIVGNAPMSPGHYKYSLEVVGPNGLTLDVGELTVIVIKTDREGWKEGLPPSGSKLREMEIASKDKMSIKPLNILKKKLSGSTIVSKADFNASIKAEDDRSLSLSIENFQIDDLLTFALAILQRYQLATTIISFNVNLKPLKREFFVMPELSDEEKKELGECKIRYFEAVGGE